MAKGSGVVCLTFDDRNFSAWREALPIFRQYDAKVTFFISGELDAATLEEIAFLQAAGHSIGLHGRNHRRAADAINECGEEAYFATEIAPQLEACCKSNIPVSAFAYPYSQQNERSNCLLSKYFRYMRTGAVAWENLSPSEKERVLLTRNKIAEHQLLYGIGLGRYWQQELKPVMDILDEISFGDRLGVFYSHSITAEQSSPNNITVALLEKFLCAAAVRNIQLLGIQQLPAFFSLN